VGARLDEMIERARGKRSEEGEEKRRVTLPPRDSDAWLLLPRAQGDLAVAAFLVSPSFIACIAGPPLLAT